MKKAQATTAIVIGGIIIVLILITIIVAFIVIVQGDSQNKEEEIVNITEMSLFLKGKDIITGEEVIANYSIAYGDNILLDEGQTSTGSWTEIKVPKKIIQVYCWGDKYYLVKGNKIFGQEELIKNISKMMCPMKPIGDLDITYRGRLLEGESTFTFNISTDKYFHKLSAVISWSPGIINAYFEGNDLILCDLGKWLNYTSVDPKTKEYNWIPDNYFRCGQCDPPYCNWTERCQSVDGNKCSPFTTKTPNRFITTADTTTYFGKSLNQESYELKLHTKSLEHLNTLDYVEITFYDKDRRWDSSENMWIYKSEVNGVNLGAEDFTVRIPFEG